MATTIPSLEIQTVFEPVVMLFMRPLPCYFRNSSHHQTFSTFETALITALVTTLLSSLLVKHHSSYPLVLTSACSATWPCVQVRKI
jgi:hypothetical protein